MSDRLHYKVDAHQLRHYISRRLPFRAPHRHFRDFFRERLVASLETRKRFALELVLDTRHASTPQNTGHWWNTMAGHKVLDRSKQDRTDNDWSDIIVRYNCKTARLTMRCMTVVGPTLLFRYNRGSACRLTVFQTVRLADSSITRANQDLQPNNPTKGAGQIPKSNQ